MASYKKQVDQNGHSDYLAQGDKVKLRHFTENDITDAYLAWLKDPVVVQFSKQRFNQHNRKTCREYLDSFSDSGNLFLCIDRLGDCRTVGTMTAYISDYHGTADIGIMLGDRGMWGKGYGLDAWKVMLNYLFQQQAIRKVTAGTLSCNHGMLKIMERSGMKLEGVKKHQELVGGQYVDIRYFALFNDD